MQISVIVPTFRRPTMLRQAIDSLLVQRSRPDAIELVVVDNDPAGSAEAIVGDAMRRSNFSIRYVHEPRAGISHARNAGLTAASGRYVAFLDDDEEAGPDWLASLWSTARVFQADVVVGPVRPRFPPGIPVSSYARRIYDRDAGVPTGHAVEWSGIGNALLQRDRCFPDASPFDPALGLSGGEDTLFLGRLSEQGCRIIWCAEAAVTEAIPADKLAARYLLRRAFRMGQTTSYLPSALAQPRWRAVLRWMAIGGLQACLYAPWSVILRLSGSEAWLGAMAKAASGSGKVLWHPALHIRNYQLDMDRRSGAEPCCPHAAPARRGPGALYSGAAPRAGATARPPRARWRAALPAF